MRKLLHGSLSSVILRSDARLGVALSKLRSLLALQALLAVVVFSGVALFAQTANRITQNVDSAKVRELPNHLPQWANSSNIAGTVPADLALDQMTLVLSRSPQQELAFDKFLADQQNPASPDYHHWLTPDEVGERFGLSEQDIATVTGWLQSQGLHVDWVAPSRVFIGFGGTAADVGRAFHTELRYYKVDGVQRISISSNSMIPEALVPAIKAIRGLYTIEERPAHHAIAMQSVSPEMTITSSGSTYHYIAPADFATIYDIPASYTGAGQTIGIVGRSRTDFADFSNFRSLTGSTFANPQEIVPTAYGGIDPGSAVTSCSTSTCTPPGDQSEATLDVVRAGSVAPGATLWLVIATNASGGIGVDTQYLVNANPLPQVITISFGACELSAGAGNVNYWDALFKQAAGEGISVFVSSGDSGASGCDISFIAPPANPSANSPNYICSSSYATCVGGTEFNDASNSSTYWRSSSGTGLASALSYIPEGGWNESTTTSVAASGGGVSAVIATPSWQTGTGVPAAKSGRYTPDIAFSASDHDGYFACLAAGGGSCVGTKYGFEVFSGTSAAAPSMAGIAALLDQKLGAAQGNLNPGLYTTAADYSSAFHDVTVATSGVSGCSISTSSMCNNSIPSPTALTGGQAGYLVTTGYDEVTGLGSLDVTKFLDNYATTFPAPTAATGSATAITASSATLSGTVNPNGADTHGWLLFGTSSTLSGASQTPSQDLGSGTTNATLSASITGLNAGTQYYFQVVAQNGTGTANGAINTFTTIASVPAPAFTIGGTSVSVAPGATTGNTSTITITPSGGFTGSVALKAVITSSPPNAQNPPTFSFGSTSPVSITGVAAGTAMLTISTTAAASAELVHPKHDGVHWYAAGSAALACLLLFGFPARRRRSWRTMLGMMVLLAGLAAGVLSCGGGGSTSTPTPTKVTPTVTVTPSPSSITAAQALTVTVAVSGGSGNSTPTGSVTLSSGSYTSTATTLGSGSATINVSAGSLATGTDTLAVIYTPDTASSPVYNSASGSNTVVVTAANLGTTAGAYTVTVTGTSGAITEQGTITLTVQ
jgi:subtilase family serine protease